MVIVMAVNISVPSGKHSAIIFFFFFHFWVVNLGIIANLSAAGQAELSCSVLSCAALLLVDVWSVETLRRPAGEISKIHVLGCMWQC